MASGLYGLLNTGKNRTDLVAPSAIKRVFVYLIQISLFCCVYLKSWKIKKKSCRLFKCSHLKTENLFWSQTQPQLISKVTLNN